MTAKYLKYFLLLLLPLLCREAVFSFANAATISDQDSVVIDAFVPAEGTGGEGGGIPNIQDKIAPVISGIKTENISETSAKISWFTDELAIPQINYGTTLEFEKTYIGDSFTLENSIFIENLQPETKYYFEVIAIDRGGNRSSEKNLGFTTQKSEDNSPPANVSGLKAEAGDSKIELSWKNPLDDNFDRITIRRSESFYPKSITDGSAVYSGKNESFIDTGLANGTKYYYSVFSSDVGDNTSSGAVVAATPAKPPTPPAKPPEKPVVGPEIPEIPEIPVEPPQIHPELKNITIDDFIFLQDGLKIDAKDGKIEIDPAKDVIVSIDAEKIPDSVGSIMIILTKENEEYSYLMKKDDKGETFSASIKLASSGSFDITIAFLDHNNKIIKVIGGNISPVLTKKTQEDRFSSLRFVFPLILLLLVVIIYLIYKKISKYRKKRKDAKSQP